MSRARKEGAKIAAKGDELAGVQGNPVSEGVKHASALDAAIDFYREQLPDNAEESKNWPFSSTIPHIIGQLNNL